MNWKAKKYPEYGDNRFKEKFFIFPTEINGMVYWLEKRRVRQTYYPLDSNPRVLGWVDCEVLP